MWCGVVEDWSAYIREEEDKKHNFSCPNERSLKISSDLKPGIRFLYLGLQQVYDSEKILEKQYYRMKFFFTPLFLHLAYGISLNYWRILLNVLLLGLFFISVVENCSSLTGFSQLSFKLNYWFLRCMHSSNRSGEEFLF